MTEAITKPNAAPDAGAIERVLVTGDLAALTPPQRVEYYSRVCASLGLNPLTKPFAYIILNGKLTLYALRDCADQLRKIHNVSISLTEGSMQKEVFIVKARASMPDGRTDESSGAVALGNLTGEALANAIMKTETKAKRRVTLSICGLGMLDETEVETVPGATRPAEPTPATPQRRSASPAPATLPPPSPAPAVAHSDPGETQTPSPATSPAPEPFTESEEVPPASPDGEDPRPPGVRVMAARLIKTGSNSSGGWNLYGFKFEDGVEATCFDNNFFALAVDAHENEKLVRYETTPGKKYGTLNLTGIELA